MYFMPYANNNGADQPAHPDAQSDQCLCCLLPRQNHTSSSGLQKTDFLPVQTDF